MISIRRFIVSVSIISLLSSLLVHAACGQPQSHEPDVEIQTVPPMTDELPTTSSQTPSMGNQPTPLSPANSNDEYNERSIVVDEHNNVFPIGIPAGYKEKREIEAQKPVDVWFEYLPQEIELEVDGVKIQRSDRWEFKVNYISDITRFNYIARNTSSQYLSYNLHITPTEQGETIPVAIKEWWSPE